MRVKALAFYHFISHSIIKSPVLPIICTCTRMCIMPTMRMLIPGIAFSNSPSGTPGAASCFQRLRIHLLMELYVTTLSIAMKIAPAVHAQLCSEP